MSFAAPSPRRSTVSQVAPQVANEPARGSGYPQGGETGQRRNDRDPWAEFNQYRRGGVWTGHDRLTGISELQEKLPGMSVRDSGMATPTSQQTFGSGSPQTSPRGNRSPRLGGVPKPFYAGSPISFSTARAMLPFLAKWISGVCRQQLDEKNLIGKMRNGLILCELVENLVPNLKMLDKPYTGQGLHVKPVANKAMLANLERALCIAWKKGVHSFNMCPAEDFVNENVPKVSRCLGELFQALQMRDILPRVKDNMLGMHAVLAQLGRPLLEPTLHDPVGYGQHVVADFADCTRVMTLLTAFGYAEVEDLARLHGLPKVPEQWRENQIITNEVLMEIGCPALLFPHEWASPPGNSYETIIFQLDVIWRGLNGSPWPGLLNNLKRFQRPKLQNFAFQDGAPLGLSHEHLQQTAANLTEISGTVSMRDRSPDNFSSVADGVSWLRTRKGGQQQGAKGGASQAEDPPSPSTSPLGGATQLWHYGDEAEDLLLLQEFKKCLLDRFEKLDLAYDAFDNRNVGLINFTDFQRGCKTMDYVGNTQRLFEKLDIEKTHQVGKVEFLALNNLPSNADKPCDAKKHSVLWREGDSEEDYEMLKYFAERIMATYGSLDKAWKAIDCSHNRTVSQIEMQMCQQTINFHGDIRKVFALMDKKRDGNITRFEFDGLQAIYDGSAATGLDLDIFNHDDVVVWQEGEPVEHLILLREFAAALHAAGFSSAAEAFEIFDHLKAGTLSITALHNGARQIEFTGDTQKLFVLLDVDKNGTIHRPEFLSLDKLPSMPSTRSQQPRWRPSPRHKHFARNNKVELLVDFPADGEDSEIEWPVEVVSPTTMEEGEARFPGSAEERAWLLEEDARRLSSLHEVGSASAARKLHSAMKEAATAAEMVADEEEMQDGDASTNLSKVQGTTSIDARVVMQDGSQQRMFVQTAVVDRTGTGSSAADDAVLVLEVRDRTSLRCKGNALDKLRGQLNVAKIVAVSQLGSATAVREDGDVKFSVTAHPSANLGGAEAQAARLEEDSAEEGTNVPLEDRPKMDDVLHWDESQRFQVLYVVAGPSAWRRREAVRFFDELRILQHFVSDGVISSAAASIGAAAGAAASAASSASGLSAESQSAYSGTPASTASPSRRTSRASVM